MKLIDSPVSFPCDAQSNAFFCALTSALLPVLGITEETPYYCAPKASLCVHCGGCGQKTTLQKHHAALYHELQTLSGVSFGWAWPEDGDCPYQTTEGGGPGWAWPDAFVGFILGFEGLSWRRLPKGTGEEVVYQAVTESIDAGFPVLMKLGLGPDWHVVTGYDEGILYGLDSHGHYIASVHPQIKPDRYTDDGLFVMSRWYESFEDAIVISGRSAPAVSLSDVLARCIQILEHPVHARLEAELTARIDAVAPDNALVTAQWLNDRASFPIEARYHAAETFTSGESVTFGLLRRAENPAVRKKLGDIFFHYIADNRDETHGVCWKIWGQLGVGPKTGYRLAPDACERLLRPETQAELKRLFSLVFANDRAVLQVLREALALA